MLRTIWYTLKLVDETAFQSLSTITIFIPLIMFLQITPKLLNIYVRETIAFINNAAQCRPISLISHPSKVMLNIILNRLKPQAEIIAEEHAGFRAGRSTTEHIFNLRILFGKYLQHQQDLYHAFIDSRRPSTGFGTQLCRQT